MLKNSIQIIVLLVALNTTSQERYTIKNIDVNTSYSNFGTTFYGEDKVVYASPKKKSFIIRNEWDGNNQPFLDLYIGTISPNGELLNVEKFSNKLNTRYHEADVAFTKDRRTVYFSRNNYLNKKFKKDSKGINLIQLYRAQITEKGEWVNVEAMPFNNDEYQTGHPTLSSDEKTLYFISDMPGTLGKTDIFKASIGSNGEIGSPINLGSKINTSEREMFASISGNDELYFSSDGRKDGLGGLDVYVSKINEKSISEPQNLGKPINSVKDDFAYIINYETRRGYFSSNRDGGKGDDDIYTFEQNVPLEFECYQEVNGTVTDFVSGSLLPGSLVVLKDKNGIEIERVLVGDNASFTFKTICTKQYTVSASKELFTKDSHDFYVTEGNDTNVILQIKKDEFAIERGKCIVKINPIYFDFDKSFIRTDAKFELDKVVEVMKKYPELIIEGGSHTDSRAPFKYNEALSTRRANSTVQYIISQGIAAKRISAKGYGERELVNGCSDNVKCSEIQHQYNRRTEFVIVNFNEIKDKYPGICRILVVSTKEQIEIQRTINESEKGIHFEKDFQIKGSEVLIRIDSIYFDFNSANLIEVKELNNIAQILKKYPSVIVEIGSHTDSRAKEEYNTIISAKRAVAIAEYLIHLGINPERLSTKGYGSSKVVNKCTKDVKCSDVEHEKNRRIEFIILNPEVIK